MRCLMSTERDAVAVCLTRGHVTILYKLEDKFSFKAEGKSINQV